MTSKNGKNVISFLSEKWENKDCPMCGKGPWQVQDKVFQLSEFQKDSLVGGGLMIPLIPITCTNCGNTLLVNAIISGGIDRESITQEKKG
ncbi:MAG: hypothetical protein FDX18_08250 [Chlorobium sp.]|nr:MAG: hypothetical protein FDX18_08250 [Chlorobium sp.]